MPALGIGGLILVASFILQTWPRWSNRFFGVDTWRHLAAADHIRRTGQAFDVMPEHYVIDAPSDYPPLLRVLLAAIPKSWAERGQWCASSLVDAVHHGLIFLLVIGFSERLDVAVATQVCYSVSPLLVMENASLTTRSLSALLFSGAVFPFLIFLGTRQVLWLLIGLLSLGLLFLAHRLALQALVVLLAVMTVRERSGWPLLFLGGGMAVAWLLSRGAYRRILSGHLAMLRCWRRNIRDRFAHQVRGVLSPRQQDPDPVFRLYQRVRGLPAMAVLAAHPVLPLMLAGFWWLRAHGWWDGAGIPQWLVTQCAVWATTLWIAGLVVRQVPPIRFLGEGERYLEYANAPAALVGGTVFASALRHPEVAWLAWGLAGALLIGGLLPALWLQRAVILRDTERSVTPGLRAILERLNAEPGDVRVITMPTYLADATMYFTKARVVSTDNSHAHNTAYEGLWPRLKRPLTELITRFSVTHVLVNEKFVTLPELQLDEAQVLLRDGHYCLLRA